MHGLVFEGGRRVVRRTFPDPAPASDEVVIRVAASGMCGSDLHYYRSEPNTVVTPTGSVCIAGHEPAGTVEELGSAVDPTRISVGDRVMVHHYAGCGRCTSCRSGWTQMCTGQTALVYGKSAHGGHAPFMTVAATSLLPLPASLSFSAGAAIGCGTGTAWGALERLGEVGGCDLVIFGQGPVGLSLTMLAAARGARVIAVDPAENRLEQARNFGAADAVDPSVPGAVEVIRDLTGGSGSGAVVDTSGTSTAAAAALEVSAPWGRFCVVGLGGTVALDVRKLLPLQLTVMTSWSMSSVQQMRCAEFVARHAIPVDALFTHCWSLEQATEAYAEFDKQNAGKGVFVF